jgi:ABC-2 type transport system ATP-binding protein
VGLDPNQIIEIRNLIKSLAGKSTVILSSHILPEVSMTCSRVIIINKGEIITMDTPENLSNSLQKVEKVHIEVEGPLDQIKSLLGEVKGVLKIESAEVNRDNRNEIRLETERNPRIRREIASLIVGKDFGLYELSTKQLTLEEIFIQMTEKGGPKE